MVAKKRKKREIDIDDIIEARVQEEISKVMDGISEPLSTEPAYKLDTEAIFCGKCLFWRENSVQEGVILNGRCNYTPLLPQRKSSDWCSKWVKR